MIAYSPLGSPRRAGRLVADPALTGIAQLVLSAEQRASVDERFHPSGASSAKSRVHRAQPVSLGDVVVVMGYPGAGKSTIASTLVADGYERLDRDERGGSLLALAATLDQTLEGGKTKVVLDNTYPSRTSRNAVVEVARRHGVEARCVWITTSLEDAQVNAVRRMIRHHGRLLSPAEMRASRDDPTALPPRAHFDYRRAFEEPMLDEGFARIEEIPFQREPNRDHTSRALFLDYGQIAAGSPATPLAGRGDLLRRYADDGWHLVVTA